MIFRGRHPYVRAIVAGTVIFCIFAPKLILLYIFAGTSIRPDDFLMMIALAALIVRGELKRTPVSREIYWYFPYLGLGFFSAIWGSVHDQISPGTALLFVMRPLQYLIFYYVGFYLRRINVNVDKILKAYIVYLCIIVPLQYRGILPVASAFDRSRASGNTFGPYELAGVCGFLVCYLGLRKRHVVWGSIAGIFILLTASRIAFIATLFVVVFSLRRKINARFIQVATASVVVAALVAGAAFTFARNRIPSLSNLTVVQRLQESGAVHSLEDVKKVYDSSPVYRNTYAYSWGIFRLSMAFSMASGSQDISGAIRLFRWCALVKSTLSGLDSTLIGLGPSFGGAAVDGNYVRMFTETGLIGMFLYALFCVQIFRSRTVSAEFKDFLVVLLITATFIDILTSYHVMILFWMWHGMEMRDEQQRREQAVLEAEPIPAIASMR